MAQRLIKNDERNVSQRPDWAGIWPSSLDSCHTVHVCFRENDGTLMMNRALAFEKEHSVYGMLKETDTCRTLCGAPVILGGRRSSRKSAQLGAWKVAKEVEAKLVRRYQGSACRYGSSR